MTDNAKGAATPAAHGTVDRGFSRLGAAGLGLGGVVVAIASRTPWMTVAYFDDRVGGGTRDVSGAQWSTEASAVALLLLIAAVAVLALRRLPRRIIGAISAVAAAGAALSPLTLLFAGPDENRVRALLTAGADGIEQTANTRGTTLSSMAELTSIDLNPAYLVLTLLGFLIAVAGGVAAALRPGEDPATLNKYETEAVRKEKIGADLEENPDSGRVLWDALDADIDPTDPGQDRPGGAGRQR